MGRRRLALICVLLVLILAGCVPYSTGPTEVGVRTIKLGIIRKAGVEDKVYPPGGTYWFLPIINDWNTFDTKLQTMEMTLVKGKKGASRREDLLFKTIDGNDISLDVIISYRINPKKAPYILQYVAKSDQELRDIVRTVARSRPRDIFGELKTEEFYVADKRTTMALKAKDALNRILNPYGITVENVLTKDYRFNPAYQRAIEERKIADQMAEKNKSAAKAAEEEYRRKLQDAIGEVNRMMALADGEFRQAKIEADAYYEKQVKVAQAILAEGEAEAKALSEMTKALAGKGGQIMVKLRLAEALKGKPIILLPISGGGIDLKTTDINRLLELYGIGSLSSRTKETPGRSPQASSSRSSSN